MTRLSLKEIENLLLTYEDKWGERNWHDWAELEGDDPTNVPGLGLVTVEKAFGGEGMGDQLWIVFKVVMDTNTEDGFVRWFRKPGYYSSYGDGGDYDGDLYEVTPKEKTVTVYE